METRLPPEVWEVYILPRCEPVGLLALASTCKTLWALVDGHARRRTRNSIFGSPHKGMPRAVLIKGDDDPTHYLIAHGTLFYVLRWQLAELPDQWDWSLLEAPSVALFEWLGPASMNMTIDAVQTRQAGPMVRLLEWCRDPASSSDDAMADVLQWIWRRSDHITLGGQFERPIPALPDMALERRRVFPAAKLDGITRDTVSDVHLLCFLIQCGRVPVLRRLFGADDARARAALQHVQYPLPLAVASNSMAMVEWLIGVAPGVLETGFNDTRLGAFALAYQNRAMLAWLVQYAPDKACVIPAWEKCDRMLATANALGFYRTEVVPEWSDQQYGAAIWGRLVGTAAGVLYEERLDALRYLVHELRYLTPETFPDSDERRELVEDVATVFLSWSKQHPMTQADIDTELRGTAMPCFRVWHYLSEALHLPPLTVDQIREVGHRLDTTPVPYIRGFDDYIITEDEI